MVTDSHSCLSSAVLKCFTTLNRTFCHLSWSSSPKCITKGWVFFPFFILARRSLALLYGNFEISPSWSLRIWRPFHSLSHSYSEQKLESMSPWPAFSYLPFVFCCLLSPFSLEISSFQVSLLCPLSNNFWLISIKTYMLSLIYDTYNIFLLFNLLIYPNIAIKEYCGDILDS